MTVTPINPPLRPQVLELTVTIEPHNIRPFFIRSHSLRVLNLSNCVNFLIAVMDTPLLERYIARGVMCHRNCVPAHSRFCMFDVLKRGAQQLDKINDVMVSGRRLLKLYISDTFIQCHES